jgi:hypothetical protein
LVEKNPEESARERKKNDQSGAGAFKATTCDGNAMSVFHYSSFPPINLWIKKKVVVLYWRK